MFIYIYGNLLHIVCFCFIHFSNNTKKGWTFNGKTGECIEIPQTMIAKENNKSSNIPTRDGTNETTQRKRRREDATAIAVQVVQGMVFIHPNYTPLEALVAIQNKSLLPPPRIPEIDMDGYKVTCAIRDFPIDWTVLMENIMDPDHGYFAHSSSGTAKVSYGLWEYTHIYMRHVD